jgi:hypothetical protein
VASTPQVASRELIFLQYVLGDLLGLTRQTVNKELAQMIRDGILARGYANIAVKDVERLAEIALSEEPLTQIAPRLA